MQPSPWLFAALGLLGVAQARAQTPECRISVLIAVRDDLGHVWRPGQTLPVDIARDAPGGRRFCAHGGACVPERVNGTRVVRLDNCAVGAAIGDGDDTLVAEPGRMGTAAARRFANRAEMEGRLVAMGFSVASAATFADASVNHPGSRRARLVARALGGSQPAIAAMRAELP